MVEVVVGEDGFEGVGWKLIDLWFIGEIHQVFYSALLDEIQSDFLCLHTLKMFFSQDIQPQGLRNGYLDNALIGGYMW